MTTIEIFISAVNLFLSITAIFISFIIWKKGLLNSAYEFLDVTYTDILKTAIDNPSFRNPELTNNYMISFKDEEKLKYEIYAFICLNFCETIFDKDNAELNKTWSIIIQTEYQLHEKWFKKIENSGKFKRKFIRYINKNFA